MFKALLMPKLPNPRQPFTFNFSLSFHPGGKVTLNGKEWDAPFCVSCDSDGMTGSEEIDTMVERGHAKLTDFKEMKPKVKKGGP